MYCLSRSCCMEGSARAGATAPCLHVRNAVQGGQQHARGLETHGRKHMWCPTLKEPKPRQKGVPGVSIRPCSRGHAASICRCQTPIAAWTPSRPGSPKGPPPRSCGPQRQTNDWALDFCSPCGKQQPCESTQMQLPCRPCPLRHLCRASHATACQPRR